jgi:SAM-dependent methyltransferase
MSPTGADAAPDGRPGRIPDDHMARIPDEHPDTIPDDRTDTIPEDHPDRVRWNARYAGGPPPSFTAHPLAVRALAMDLPAGPIADLACGTSGTALLAAAGGRQVTAVDVSELALGMLREEARLRGLAGLITFVHADLAAWRPEPRGCALLLCTGFWSAPVFAAAAVAVAPGGILGWEAFTVEARRSRPGLPPEWCLRPGEPASLLPADFTVISQSDLPARARRQMLARRAQPD